ncbi:MULTISPECIES: hypothetical protein [Sphingomonas]|uniref:hypothetical protein n=1 Tax=Sphingomonas TaxID=13687 RepID=UPI000DEF297C|nr:MULTISPECIES: hypothetical protein [Sphingomonas]
MFRTVRHWWSEGSGQHTARLFVFELTVVIAGVLIAQGLANAVTERGQQAQMEDSRRRARRQLGDNLAYGLAWKAAIPCLDQRMQNVIRSDPLHPMSKEMLERPRMAAFYVDEIDNQSELLMRQRHGDADADKIKQASADIALAQHNVDAIIHAWGRLSLLDPTFGKPSDADRTVARAAAADVRAELRGLDFLIGELGKIAQTTGVASHTEDRIRPARTCEEMWRSNATYVSL